MQSAIKNIGNIRLRALLPIVVTFIFALGLIVFFTTTFFDNQQHQINRDITQRVQHRFDAQIQNDILNITGILQLISQNPGLISVWQKRDRESLTRTAQQLYKGINDNFEITHFYFHTPTGKNFLRAHRPGRFGDNINRKTLLTARRTGQPTAGLELGTFGQFVLRVVQPWTIDGKIVGYLELGKEIANITHGLKQIAGAEIVTIIDKRFINKNEWQKVFGEKYNWQQLDKWVIASSTLNPTPSKLTLLPENHEQVHKSHLDSNGNSYVASHFPLSDFSGTTVGYMAVIHNITANDQQLHKLLSNIVIVGLKIISIISIAYFIYLGKIEDQLTQTNRSLHQKIGEHKKTENNLKLKHDELTAINRELESYSYSIAHDLRAPLRSITSFSQIVLEDTKDKLTTEDTENLNRVVNAGKRMAELIDDILQLSRITRENLSVETINISKIAELTKHQLSNSNLDRQVKWDIQADMFARADSLLLARAIENLINNAWKYTRYTENAEISFGTTQKHNETVYFVRDNGAGFDMNYAHKLFATFQRLHNPREFSGSGIGLAIALRVIQRHHGRIWGEGEVGKGATFYFTLPNTLKT